MRRPPLLLALGLGIALSGALWLAGGGQPQGASLIPEECAGTSLSDQHSLRLLTWNVHYGAGSTDRRGRVASADQTRDNLDAIAQAIAEWRPDLVALQEVDRQAWRSHGIDAFTRLRQASALPCGAWTDTWDAGWVPWPGLWPGGQIGQVRSGQGFLSRAPLTAPQRHALPQITGRALINHFSLHRSLLQVQVDLGGRQLTLINPHLEAFDAANRQTQIERLARLASGPDVVVLGDMNTDALTIPGLRHAIPHAISQATPSSWATWPASSPTAALDHLLYGQGLELVSVRVPHLDPPPSDHLPLLIELRLRPRPATPEAP